ncbi:hypothetical protein GCM10010435_85310 [Winogradskya consettensis]|uniref:Uncharacterized protein n=2 Tax=Winogradskya consettensis TaxID=113560 RepID=A0A919VQI4_9ACTN|nr:hypothetical protein Aco04nite_31090 [Actinoplanes consettensis]
MAATLLGMKSSSTESPARIWLRRLVIAVSCAPLAALSVLHTMGRSEDFGVLGRWYVMVPLAVGCYFAWNLIEKAISWTTPVETREEA